MLTNILVLAFLNFFHKNILSEATFTLLKPSNIYVLVLFTFKSKTVSLASTIPSLIAAMIKITIKGIDAYPRLVTPNF